MNTKLIIIVLGVILLNNRVLAASPQSPELQLAKQNACMTCHAVDHKLIGPPFQAVSARYRNDPHAADKLLTKITHGGAGNWGNTPMPPNPQANPQDLKKIVQWILAQ